MKLKFIPMDFWALNSPGRSPVDCQIWGMMQDRVHQMPVGDMTHLRWFLIDTWHSLSQSTVDDATDEWWNKLQACVNEKKSTFRTLAIITELELGLVVQKNWMLFQIVQL